jgi:hypothetical protein
MNLLDLFEGASDNLRSLIQAIQSGGNATMNIGGEPITLDSHEARWMYGKYKAFLRAGRQEEFIQDLNDPVRFDAHMRQLRSLIDKQKNFRGSVPGQRQVQGDVPQGLSEEIQSLMNGLNEQDISPKAMGVRHVGLLDKTKMTPEPVIIDFGPGKKFRITAPQDKRWFLNAWQGYQRTGQGDRFLEMMGTPEGFERVLDMFANEHRQKQQRQARNPGHQQKRKEQYMSAYQPRTAQKKNFSEADEVTPKTKRFMQRLRVQYPQARSDSEALMYHITGNQEKTQKEIDDLEKQSSSMEKDIRQDLMKHIDSLSKRRGVTGGSLAQVRATTDKQQEIINKIIKIDQEQQRALNDLESSIKGTASTTGASTGGAYRSARPSEPSTVTQTPGTAPAASRPQKQPMAEPTSPAPAQQSNISPVSIDLTDTEPVDIGTTSAPSAEIIPFSPGRRRRKNKQQSLPLGPGGDADNVTDIRDVLKVAESLLDEERHGIRVSRDDNENIISTNQELDEKQDACYQKVKSRYKVWPSAYASGALVQCRKKGAANWGDGGKKK